MTWHDLGGALSDDAIAPVALQPLVAIDDDAERSWAAQWVAAILAREGVVVTPEAKGHVWSALSSLASAPAGERTLTGLAVLLQSGVLKRALQPYCLGGPWGRLLDAEAERLGRADVQAFETEGLIGAGAASSVLAYLFHRVEARLDGRPTLLIIDEGWLALDDPTFGAQLREWLKTLRKKNAAVVFATQYRAREIPDGVLFLTAGIDVQKSRLVYVIRGWGVRQESWLIEHGELWGETEHHGVWTDLAELLHQPVGDLMIRRAFIDSGFRPGKRDEVPEHRVYEFCRRFARVAYAAKGFDHRDQPLSVKRIDVTPKGKAARYGLDLVRLDSDFFKSWVHQRVRWPDDQPGGWHVPSDATEAYCRQIVSEGRVKKPSGGYMRVQRSRENHDLDCEAMAYCGGLQT